MILSNKITAIITGGASGLGAATARLFAEKGVNVAIIDTNIFKAEALAEEIGAKAYSCDVTSAEEAKIIIQNISDQVGIPRILVNCAGIATPSRILGKHGVMALDFFQHIVEVNLIGTFNMLRLAAEKMMELDPIEDEQRGVIISTASIAAYEGQIGQSAYAASKGGIISLTLPAARELASVGIRVNTIAPGVFMTPLIEALPKEAQDSLALSIPNPNRLGKPQEFAKLAVHIAENDYINGETIRIDASLRMQPK
jgi:NAD(P)-dependent dehydrogenase (short-subunit alcohol dehydrogenase family)